MSNELTTTTAGTLALLEEQLSAGAISTEIGTEDQFDELSKGAFLGRLTLYSKQDAVIDGKIPAGHYGVPQGEKTIIDLGPKTDVLVLARRPKAMDFSQEPPVVSYDPNSKTFQDIEARFAAKGSTPSQAMVGTSFLVIERSTGQFLELYLGGKSTAPIAKSLAPYLPTSPARAKAGEEVHGPQVATLTVEVASNTKGRWHVPAVSPCSVPFNRLPSISAITREIKNFLTVESDEVVKQEEGRAR